jgi:hypothetical protein
MNDLLSSPTTIVTSSSGPLELISLRLNFDNTHVYVGTHEKFGPSGWVARSRDTGG